MSAAILQICTASVAALCFALLFNVRGRKLPIVAVGGAAAWGLYLLLFTLSGNLFLSLFFASAGVTLLSELLARRLAAPTTVFLVPILIPLFPGGDLYRAAAALVRADGSFSAALLRVMVEAGAIAAGIVLISSLVQTYYRIKRHWHHRNGGSPS